MLKTVTFLIIINFFSISVVAQDTAKSYNFSNVEVDAYFPGGSQKWKKYLSNTLDSNLPKRNKAPKGHYTIIVSFVINKEGYINDISFFTNPGYGMIEELIRVFKGSPKWQPASINGRYFDSYRKQPITFIVD